jgi:hypothetical protein
MTKILCVAFRLTLVAPENLILWLCVYFDICFALMSL